MLQRGWGSRNIALCGPRSASQLPRTAASGAGSAAAARTLWGVMPRRSRFVTGFLVLDGGQLRIGSKGIAAQWLLLEQGQVVVRSARASSPIQWDDITAVRLAERPGSALRVAPYELVIEHRGGAATLALKQPSGGPLARRHEYDAVLGLLDFCRTYASARVGLNDPAVLECLLVETDLATRQTRRPPPAARRWAGVPDDVVARLDETMAGVVRAAGVECFAGRTVRGYRIEPDAATVSQARAWLTPDVAAYAPPDDVVAAALDAAQGSVPPWPFDGLLAAPARGGG